MDQIHGWFIIKFVEEWAIPLAVVGALLFTALLLLLFFKRLGLKGSAVVLGVLVAYLLATRWLGERRAATQAVAAARETVRRQLVLEQLDRLASLPAAALQETCEPAAPLLQLGELVLVHRTHKDLAAVDYRNWGGELVGRSAVVTTEHDDLLAAWQRMATHPFLWSALLHDTWDYKLSRMHHALVVAGDRAVLLDLDAGTPLCAGRLTESFDGDHHGDELGPAFAKPLLPLCRHFDGALCPVITKSATRPPS